MQLLNALPRRRPLLTILLWSGLAVMASQPVARASRPSSEVGLRLLKAQIPANASLRRLTCKQISRAVHSATLTHRANAVQILVAGLSLNAWDTDHRNEARLDCPCVIQVFNAAATAAPERAATLLETAQAIHPECADGLTAALRGLEQRIVVAMRDGKDGVGISDIYDPGDDGENDGNGDGNGGGATLGSGLGDGFGNGSGLGPGFPGAPGFGGSAPSGGFILPPPVGGAVTIVVNN